ncbi:hypothetical protein [Streptomyces sp. NPDC058595]|uniref:hypothetical protein n=1 Tax=Streptomyces sp. NPDC058595 TaxID=3346550 RepID=UPI00364CCF62
MTSVHWAFDDAQEYGRAALIGHLAAGVPDVAGSVRALQVLSRHVDVLEVGLDDSHLSAVDAVRVISAVTASVRVPVLLRTPWEPMRLHSPRALAAALAGAEAAGVVLPDLHPYSRGAGQWLRVAAKYRLATVFSACDSHVYAAVAASTGWVRLPVAPAYEPSDALDVEAVRAHAWMLASISLAPICASGYLRPDQAAAIAPTVDAIEVDAPFARAVQLARGDGDFALLDQCGHDYATAVRARATGRHLSRMSPNTATAWCTERALRTSPRRPRQWRRVRPPPSPVPHHRTTVAGTDQLMTTDTTPPPPAGRRRARVYAHPRLPDLLHVTFPDPT